MENNINVITEQDFNQSSCPRWKYILTEDELERIRIEMYRMQDSVAKIQYVISKLSVTEDEH